MKKLKKTVHLIIFLIGGLFCFDGSALGHSRDQELTWISGHSYYPAISIDAANNVYVAWRTQKKGRFEIYGKMSTDGGRTWSVAKRLILGSSYSWEAATAKDLNNNIHVVWYDDTSDNCEIYFKTSTDGGETWSEPVRLTWSKDKSRDPAICVDSDNQIHVVWCNDASGSYDIYYKKSLDGGETWTEAKRLTWSSGDSFYPTLAIDSKYRIYVVWYDNTSGKSEIFYKKSLDRGATWTDAVRLTWTSGKTPSPSLAIDSDNNIHVVWEDSTPGNFEIYYKKGNQK